MGNIMIDKWSIVIQVCVLLRNDTTHFKKNTAHSRGYLVLQVMRPVGVLAEGRNLYVVDVRSKLVYLYGLAESLRNSPVKKAPKAIL